MQVPVGICILSGDELYVEIVNDSFLEITGRQQQDL
jgi:hypothetical protein